jgi:hypothetical protein
LTARWLDSLRAFVLADLDRLRVSGVGAITLETVAEADLDLGEGRTFPVLGRLDRMVEGPSGRRVADYKSAGNLRYRVDAKNMVRADTLQAPLYLRIAAASEVELLGVGPAYAKEEGEGRRAILPRLGALEEGFVETLRVLQDLLQHGAYPLNEKGPCGWCDYRRACRRTHPPTLAREKGSEDARDFRDVKDKTAARKTLLREVRAARARGREVPA